MDLLLKAGHVTANLFWLGGIVAVAIILLASDGSDQTRGALGHRVYMRIAVPAFVLSFVLGFGRLGLDASAYMKQGWFHAKLLFALIVIGLHHVIGARAKKMAAGDADAGKTKVLAIVLAISGALAAFVAVWRFGK
ncbi:MAG: CopD family protein [Polyangiaceae bacterium]